METGSLLLTEEGAVVESAGELENDERLASGVIGLVNLTSRIDPQADPKNDGFKKITITYDDHCFMICMTNKKIHVVKKMLDTSKQTDSNAINI